jgi:hypothetical protein
MSNIKFVSHEEFPDDLYTKEVVYLLIDDKYRVAYLRKQSKNGGMFWSAANFSVTKEGVKTYYEAFMQDSSFLEKDIKLFLDKRSWEPEKMAAPSQSFAFDTALPF